MTNTIRQIHTGFYAARTKDIIHALQTKAIADCQNCKRTFKIKSVRYLTVNLAVDNEVVLECNSTGRWTSETCFKGWNDAQALNHMAWVYKNIIVRKLAGTNAAWKRDCTAEVTVEGVTFTVQEFYCIYDSMRQRKGADKRYSKELVEKLRGMPLDPIMTEMKIAQAEEIARLETDLNLKIKKLESERYEEQERTRKQIAATYAAKIEATKAETEAEIKRIREEMNAMFIAA